MFFFYVPFALELLFTNVTVITSSKCFFMCKRQLKHSYIKCVEKNKHRILRHFHLKHKHILIPSQRYQDSRNIF